MKGKMYCINLYEREDRYNTMKKQFTRISLDVEFVRNHKHPRGGRYGCFDSHIQCFRDAQNNNLDYFIIFEDDNLLYDNAIENINKAVEYIKNNDDIDMIFLHNRLLLWCKEMRYDKKKQGLYRCNCLGNSCILFTRPFVSRVLNSYMYFIENTHIDSYLCCLTRQGQGTAFIPDNSNLVTYSFPSASDNDNWGILIMDILKNYVFPHSTTAERMMNDFVFFICKRGGLTNTLWKLFLEWCLSNEIKYVESFLNKKL